jgi:succinate dehydrogenase / fumarate reductase membrane anchor subunit
MKSLRSPLGRMRGLGSAKDGTAHWWAQRVTAVALVPLTLWFVAATIALVGRPPGDVAAWVADPFRATLLIALLVALFHHAQLGLQVVIEDYVHAEGAKLVLLFVVKGACWVLASIGIVSVLKIVTIFPVVMMMRGG